MSSPVVESAPIFVENNGINTQKNTGFPFEDDFEDRHSFRSQLDEIAQRHPEFAEHLHFDQLPLRSRRRRGSDERTQPPPENRRFERPFRSRFEEFGFPFSSREFEEPEFYREEQTFPREPQEDNRANTKKNEAEGDRVEIKKNIQQSNTVDLGKNQEPVDDQRGQRSMSAPPENRPAQQRFVSSINIPVQGQSTSGPSGDMGAKPSQPQVEKPTERVIPIHVEGRDEPVLPKNPNFTPTPQQQQQPPPQPERIFGRNPSHFTQFLNKGEPQMTPEEYFKHQQRNHQQKHQEAQSSPKQHHEEKPQKSTQLDQIQNIQKDVSELMNQVEKFEGKPKDKQYLYLDEMLTRNLIKLDNIETEGKDNIRHARKEAIKCIESCIGILEAKANANQAKENPPDDVQMEVEKLQEPPEEHQEKSHDNKKDHHKEKPQQEEKHSEQASLEVSGVARSGSIVNTETPMEVVAEVDNTTEKKQEDEKKEEEQKEEATPSGDASTKSDEKGEEKKEKKKTVKKKEKAEKK